MDQNRPAPLEDLTPRDIDVLTLLAEGLSNPEIAERLVLEVSTVKWYVRQLYAKLQIDDALPPRQRRRQLADLAKHLGLVDVDEYRQPIPHNLPAQTTPFIGRAREMLELQHRIGETETRLITILGPGGMGKTRLALEAARQQLSTSVFANGVYFVPLQALASAEDLITAIGQNSGFPFMTDERKPKQQLLDYLRHKQLLLVLDNFEHLLAGANLISDILTAAPGVQVLVTSRERLNLHAETVYTISGMAYPDVSSEGDHTAYDATSLFVHTAQQVRRDFTLTDENLSHIARICRLVDGMPLGIILAAAWVEVLSLNEIANEIARSIDILTAEMHDVPRRHWSIQAVFDPTWGQLSASEQMMFMKFAVFRGGCTRDAAQSVTGATLRHLHAFVNKALLTRTPVGRYEMHELLRQYAGAKLDEAGEADVTQDAHARYYADFVADLEGALKGSRQRAALDDIKTDFENVRAAWLWAAEQRNFETVERIRFGLQVFCDCRTDSQSGWALLDVACQHLAPKRDEFPHRVWGHLLISFPFDRSIANLEERAKRKRELAERSLEIARHHDDLPGITRALIWLGQSHWEADDYTTAKQLLEKSLNDRSDCFYVAEALTDLGICYIFLDKLEMARQYWEEAVAINLETGNKITGSGALNNLGIMALWNGEYKVSGQYLHEYLTQARAIDNRPRIVMSLLALSWNYFVGGHFDAALELIENASRISMDLGIRDFSDLGYAIAAILNQDYEQAIQICHASRRPGSPRSKDSIGVSNWLQAIAALSLADHVTARNCILEGGQWIVQWQHLPTLATKTWYLPLAAVVLAWEKEAEYAAELLGLAHAHPASATGWLKLPLMVEFCDNLKAQLGPKTFAIAWERGQSLDLDTVITDLLQRWDNSIAG